MTDFNSIKGKLPLYQEETVTVLDEPRLAKYFLHYDFARLQGLYDQYHMGTIKGKHDVVCHHWRRADARRSALVVHGLFDHAGLFLPLVKFLLEIRVNVVVMELPDHGLSSMAYGQLSDFDSYSSALASLFESKQISMTGPVAAIGQSTGAAVIFDYLSRHRDQAHVNQLILLAPLLRVRSWMWVKASHALLHRFLTKVPRKFLINSHDQAFCEFLAEHDPLQPDFISVAWVGAMLRWAGGFGRLATVDIPALLVQGTADKTVAYRYNTARYAEKLPQLEVQYIDGAMHHLVGEADPWQAKVFEAIGAFVMPDGPDH